MVISTITMPNYYNLYYNMTLQLPNYNITRGYYFDKRIRKKKEIKYQEVPRIIKLIVTSLYILYKL